jgi:hypothetical protein
MKKFIITAIYTILFAYIVSGCAVNSNNDNKQKALTGEGVRRGNLFRLDASYHEYVENIKDVKLEMLSGELLEMLGDPKSVHTYQDEKTFLQTLECHLPYHLLYLG